MARLTYACQELNGRGLSLPSHWRMHSDNATSEQKNQSIMKFGVWLVHRGRFKPVEMTMDRVGHSHGRQDQRFAVVAEALSNCEKLEDPQAFADAIKQQVRPSRNRLLHTEIIEAAYDWDTYFDQLGVSVGGHTGLPKQGLEGCHVFRFVRRADLLQKDIVFKSWRLDVCIYLCAFDRQECRCVVEVSD